MIGFAAETTKTKGRPTDDRRSFIKVNLWFKGSYRLPTFKKKMKLKRSSLRNDGASVLWSAVENRKGYLKVSPQSQRKLSECFLKHPHAIPSPTANDTHYYYSRILNVFFATHVSYGFSSKPIPFTVPEKSSYQSNTDCTQP
jgi:hypothetical protein